VAKRQRKKRSPVERALTLALSTVVLFALALVGWLFVVYPQRAPDRRGRERVVRIPAGASVDEAAAILAREDVIADPFVFAVYARLLGATTRLRDGEIALRDDMTPHTVLMRIARGLGLASVEVLVPEGFSRFEIAARLDHWGVCAPDAFLAATEDEALLAELEIPAASAEGYLFPDTYVFHEGDDPDAVIRTFVAAYRRNAASLIAERDGSLDDLGLDAHAILTLASIVEEEAAVEEERPIIAGVFLNRLRSATFLPRQRLQADPTVSYGCRVLPDLAPSCAGFDGRITTAMLEDSANPYNTYRHAGLPPGPITNPGLASIRAVLSPTAHDYLYFVARGGRRHAFSATFERHLDGVDALRDREAAAAP
jgi:UPF0755 protein